MFKIIRIVFLLVILTVVLVATVARADTGTIDVLTVKGTITPVLADYIKRGIEHAEDNFAEVCIIQMDTPGGLDTAMRDIVKDIVNSRVPVVVYVSPSGARAASAGVFITVAAHVAAMAPNTAIGAASPVSVGPEGEQEISETMQEKILNDAAAYIRSIAEEHGRNVEWAEQAVREAVSATEREALELNVIDIVASDMEALVNQLDGREVTMLGRAVVTLDTQDASINVIEMNWVEEFLFAITEPNIAFVLLSLGTLGLMVEIYSPGLIFPGVAGGICLILAFYSLGNLPVNIAGVLLIALAFALFIAEIFTPTFGLLTAGGITALIIGALILFKGGPLFQVNPWLVGGIAVSLGAVIAFIISRVIVTHRKQAYTGWEELIGKTALVKAALDPEGMVLYKGERWAARTEGEKVKPGEEVIIDRVESLKLYVSKKQQGDADK